MTHDHSAKYLDRWREDDVHLFVSHLCPTEATRPLAAQCVAETMIAAHSHNPESWGITRKPKSIRLNVGRLEAVVWAPGRHALLGLGWGLDTRGIFPERPFLALMVDLPTLKNAGALRHVEQFLRREYRLVNAPDSCYIAIPTADPQEFTRLQALVRAAHLKHLAHAAKKGKNGATAKGHHPGLVDAIASLAGRPVPQPTYVHVARPEFPEVSTQQIVTDKRLTDEQADSPVPLPKTGFNFKPGSSKKVTTATASLTEKDLDLDLRHNVLQETLYQRLASQYGKSNVGTEQDSGAGTLIDIAVRMKNEYFYYEIKTALTPRACLREAIGQLLEYAFWPGAQEPTRFIIVGESLIDEDGQEYLRRLRKRFSLPIEYEAIVI